MTEETTVQLEGSHLQCYELLEAITLRRMILMRFIGSSPKIDADFAASDDIMSFWQQQLKSKGVE